MPQPVDDDSTIRLTRPISPGAKAPRLPPWVIAAPILLLVLGAAGGWMLWPSARPPAQIAALPAQRAQPPPQADATPPPGAVTAPVPPVSVTGDAPATRTMAEVPHVSPAHPEFSIGSATEQQILDHVPAEGSPDPTVFQFRANPRILVLDFASLRDQGRMLNRVAALIEKFGSPHDRLLSDDQLEAAIRTNGDTVETYYYGHDYDAASLIRFFALADRDGVRLMGEEDRLGRLIRQAGWFEPDARAALISLPQVGADKNVTRVGRATILHHELSHGEYFTNPAYAAFAHRFWTQTLTPAERDRIRHHLHTQGYDPALEDVMENEAQAYLMFTDSGEFFRPDMIGMSKARLAELRNGFARNMPPGWLRDSLNQTLSASKPAAAHP